MKIIFRYYSRYHKVLVKVTNFICRIALWGERERETIYIYEEKHAAYKSDDLNRRCTIVSRVTLGFSTA